MVSNTELEVLLAEVRRRTDDAAVPPEQRVGSREQVISFVYGNCALENLSVTRELVTEVVDEYLARRETIYDVERELLMTMIRKAPRTPAEIEALEVKGMSRQRVRVVLQHLLDEGLAYLDDELRVVLDDHRREIY